MQAAVIEYARNVCEIPNANSEEFSQIIDYLNINNDKRLRKKEMNKMQNYFKSLNNDLIIEKEIVNIVEEQRKNKKIYEKLFKIGYSEKDIKLIFGGNFFRISKLVWN